MGAGVSLATTGGNPFAGALGFLESGIAFVEREVEDLPAEWGNEQRARVASPGVESRIAAADEVVRAMGGRASPDFAHWLRESIGDLPVVDASLVEAVAALKLPLITLNYDDLIEEVTGLPAVTWRESRRMQRVIRGDEQGVVHLHGHWRDPASIVFATESYEDVLADQAAHEAVRALSYTQSFMLVGFGGPLDSANFRTLRAWMPPRRGQSEYRHFRLVRADELTSYERYREERERVTTVTYGQSYADLAPFLRSLSPPSLEREAQATLKLTQEIDWTKWGAILAGVGVAVAVVAIAVELLV
jgi:hypothetical protein